MLKNATPDPVFDAAQRTTPLASDPVHFSEGMWWFWDETWADCLGPFTTETAARTALREYCEKYL